jgi:MFS family permease
MLIASRFLAGCAGAAPLAVGGGSIADLIPLELRGRAVAIYSLGPVLAPTLTPIAGGYVTKVLGWRWIFYILTILISVSPRGTTLFILQDYRYLTVCFPCRAVLWPLSL